MSSFDDILGDLIARQVLRPVELQIQFTRPPEPFERECDHLFCWDYYDEAVGCYVRAGRMHEGQVRDYERR